jgi:hypothetical protein
VCRKVFFFKARPKKIFEGNAIAFLISRTALRGFFAILTTHRGTLFSTLEGLSRPEVLASIGLNCPLLRIAHYAEFLVAV